MYTLVIQGLNFGRGLTHSLKPQAFSSKITYGTLTSVPHNSPIYPLLQEPIIFRCIFTLLQVLRHFSNEGFQFRVSTRTLPESWGYCEVKSRMIHFPHSHKTLSTTKITHSTPTVLRKICILYRIFIFLRVLIFLRHLSNARSQFLV